MLHATNATIPLDNTWLINYCYSMKAYLNASEVAKLLKLNRATVARWAQQGKFKGANLTHQGLRILFTMYRSTTNHSSAVVDNARKIWCDNILSMQIPHSTIFARSYDEKTPVTKLEPHHPGAIAYDVLADWLVTYNDENA